MNSSLAKKIELCAFDMGYILAPNIVLETRETGMHILSWLMVKLRSVEQFLIPIIGLQTFFQSLVHLHSTVLKTNIKTKDIICTI